MVDMIKLWLKLLSNSYYEKSFSGNSTIDISNLSIGTYIIELTTNKEQMFRQYIIKQ